MKERLVKFYTIVKTDEENIAVQKHLKAYGIEFSSGNGFMYRKARVLLWVGDNLLDYTRGADSRTMTLLWSEEELADAIDISKSGYDFRRVDFHFITETKVAGYTLGMCDTGPTTELNGTYTLQALKEIIADLEGSNEG
ncbi:hypothetical protein QE321_gp042 [Pseudomonas phage SPA01]|uniref:Uncharacterized protein n=1 Tax=Pseudomonas phage SPA01 TaxID=3003719 RepID=A0A9Y1W083_9CAUD|nr:hypothetical protein QE321_gp042 [Pseudomonas phage SPA01]WFG74217.1 hypothetical protein DOEKDBNA_00176 [Pseudomonas phage SPA01]